MSGLSAGRTGTPSGGTSSFFTGRSEGYDDAPVYMGATILPGTGPVIKTLPDGTEVRGANTRVVKTLPNGTEVRGARQPVTAPNLVGRSQAIQTFYSWSDAERAKWAQHLLRLGLIEADEVTDYHLLEKWWKQIVDDTANLTMAGKKLTPFQVATLIAGGEEGAAARRAGAAARQPFSGTKTQTSTSVDLTDPTTARVLVNSVLKEALGRAANPEEVAAFTATLNAAERNNPVRTTTNSTYQADELVSQSSKSEGGLSGAAREQVVMDQAMKKPEYGAYQAATYYFNALASAIQSPV